MTDTAKPTVDAVVDAALTRTLTLLARVSRRQGWTYDGPALLIARELFPHKVNARTWAKTFGGHDWSTSSWYDLAYYSGRGYAREVTSTLLREEYEGVGGTAVVSRETPVITLPVPADPIRTCTCRGCTDEGCPGPDQDEGCGSCDDHGCEACYGEDYRCDDHGCDTCRPDCYTQSCCGYCSECSAHPDGPDDSDTCSNCGYCHDCGHVCGDVD